MWIIYFFGGGGINRTLLFLYFWCILKPLFFFKINESKEEYLNMLNVVFAYLKPSLSTFVSNQFMKAEAPALPFTVKTLYFG